MTAITGATEDEAARSVIAGEKQACIGGWGANVGADAGSDPLVAELRREITANDRDIVRALNQRLELVRRLKEHKAAAGYDFLDESREAELLAELEEANAGPLSSEGLRELHAALLDLTKRELES